MADIKRVQAVIACEDALDHARKMGAAYDSIVKVIHQLTQTATGGDPRLPLELPEQPIVWAENLANEMAQRAQAFRDCVTKLRACVSPELTEMLAESLRNEKESAS
jgi:hypothetical protein